MNVESLSALGYQLSPHAEKRCYERCIDIRQVVAALTLGSFRSEAKNRGVYKYGRLRVVILRGAVGIILTVYRSQRINVKRQRRNRKKEIKKYCSLWK